MKDEAVNYAIHSFWIISIDEMLFLCNLEPFKVCQKRMMSALGKQIWHPVQPIESLLYKGLISYQNGTIELNEFLKYLFLQLSSSEDDSFELNKPISCKDNKVLIQLYPYQPDCTKIAILPKEEVHENFY